MLESFSLPFDRSRLQTKENQLDITPLNHKRTFTLEEARSALPVVYRVTEATAREVRLLLNRMESVKGMNASKAAELEKDINLLIDRWQQKVQKLGAHPKGLWLADFDDGKGYYCWKFPETDISYWHGYNDGFSGRTPLRPEENAQ